MAVLNDIILDKVSENQLLGMKTCRGEKDDSCIANSRTWKL